MDIINLDNRSIDMNTVEMMISHMPSQSIVETMCSMFRKINSMRVELVRLNRDLNIAHLEADGYARELRASRNANVEIVASNCRLMEERDKSDIEAKEAIKGSREYALAKDKEIAELRSQLEKEKGNGKQK